MRLVLESGYPYPLPAGFDVNHDTARSHEVVLYDVVKVEWLDTLTVEFSHLDAYQNAMKQSRCWQRWSHMVLEAVVSDAGEYGRPAIVFGDKAYCGLLLLRD